jgi:hypothetical protein
MEEPIVVFDAELASLRYDDSPFSTSTTDNWVARNGGLPSYIRAVTRGIEKSGHSFSESLSMAISVMHIWATGHNPWSKDHKGHVTPAVQAKATAALAEWEALKAKAHASSRSDDGFQFLGEVQVRVIGTPAGGDHAKGHPFYGNGATGSLNKPKPGQKKTAQQKAQAQQQQKQKAHSTASQHAKKTMLEEEQAKSNAAGQQALLDAEAMGPSKLDVAGANAEAAAMVKTAENAPPVVAKATKASQANKASGTGSGGSAAYAASQAAYAAKSAASPAAYAAQQKAQAIAQAQKDAAYAALRLHTAMGSGIGVAKPKDLSAAAQGPTIAAQAASKNEVEKDESTNLAPVEEAAAAAGHQVRDGMGGTFVGEAGTTGAANFLPAGPSLKQDQAIHDEQTKGPHRFQGADLDHCAACDKPVTDPVHRVSNKSQDARVSTVQSNPSIRSIHPFQGGDLMHCTVCDQSITDPVHVGLPGQPIPPVPREAHALRHAGHDHAPVVSGHVNGIPERHKAAAYKVNQKNYDQATDPLTDTMKSFFNEQRQATVNRLMGKRGGRMLKRAAQSMENVPLPQPQTTPPPQPPPPITTAALQAGQVNLSVLISTLRITAELAAERLGYKTVTGLVSALAKGVITIAILRHAFPRQVAKAGDAIEAPPEVKEAEATVPGEPEVLPDVDPQDIFDQSFWDTKLESTLVPHLQNIATLAQTEVGRQVGLPVDTDDSSSLGAVQGVLKRKAAETAKYVNNTTAEDLTKALQSGVAAGEGRDAIAKRVNDVFDHADIARAKTIAQTATVSAYNEAQHIYAQNLPPETVGKKVWLAHHDSRTRVTHRAADLQEKPLNAHFIVGGSQMMYPGDTEAPLDETINCRCGVAYLPPKMDYGNVQQAAQDYMDGLKTPPPSLALVG